MQHWRSDSRIHVAEQLCWCGLDHRVGRVVRFPRRRRVVRWDSARHIEELSDRDVLPRGIVRQPLPDGIVERQQSGGFELQDDGRGKCLCIATDL